MRESKYFTGMGLLVCLLAASCCRAEQAELKYRFDAGGGTELTFAPPKIEEVSIDAVAPASYQPAFERQEPWPGKSLISLHPKYDEDHILILGGLYRAVLPESVVITTTDETRAFVLDTDFKVNGDWGQVAAIDQRLGETGKAALKVRYQYATQRLDLVQADASGKLSVKQGQPRMVCPSLPAADEGHKAVAGVYIAPWRREGVWKIADEDVLMIHAVGPVMPVGPEHLAKMRTKLAAGQTVRIAFIGDSITLGAESGSWWDKDVAYTEKDATFRGQVIVGLRKMYPKATVEPIEAFKGGEGTPYGVKILKEVVLPAKADMVILTLGTNDVYGPVGGQPKTPLPEYRKAITDMVKVAHENGMDVLLVVAMPLNPWMRNGVKERWPEYRQVLLDVGRSEGCTVADVCTAWEQQAAQGVPPYSQLHNWINHPGPAGHVLFAQTILRCFEGSGKSSEIEQSQKPQTTREGMIVQPAQIPGKWTLGEVKLPAAETIIAMPASQRPVYGLYTWCGEYRTFRKQIKDVGWRSVRIGGPMDDATMAMLVADDMEVMKTLGMDGVGKRNRSEYESDDAFIADYVANIEKFMQRYGPGGTFFGEHPELPVRPIVHVEILNEPNFQYMIPPRKGVEWRAMEAERFALYAKVLPAAYGAIKAKWPGVEVVGFAAGGSASADVRYIKAVLEAGDEVGKGYDVLSTHPYMDNVPPESYSIHSWGKYSIIDNLAAIRSEMAGHGAAGRPVWYTEVGWRISKDEGGRYEQSGDAVVTQMLQAAYSCRLYAMSVRMGVGRVHSMFVTDTDNYNGGFFRRDDGAYRMSADATKVMIGLMTNPKLEGVIAESTDGVYAYRFVADGQDAMSKRVVMAWCVTGEKQMMLDWAGDSATVIDMLGHEQQVRVSGGKVSVTIGPCPIYVR